MRFAHIGFCFADVADLAYTPVTMGFKVKATVNEKRLHKQTHICKRIMY